MHNTIKAKEKLMQRGASTLTDTELIQIIVSHGLDDADSHAAAKQLDSIISEISVNEINVDYAKSIGGIGDAEAAIIIAALELGRRKYEPQVKPLIDTPEAAAAQFEPIRSKSQEYFCLLTLDGARRLIKNRIITIGTLTSSLVHPREVFAPAIEDRAASIIVGHNHPSGMLDISEQDREVSECIKQAGDLLGIRLDDHIVVAGGGFASAM